MFKKTSWKSLMGAGKPNGACSVMCLFLILAMMGIVPSTAFSTPINFSIDVTGVINGEAISYGTVGASGVVDPLGYYSATLVFDNLPSGFHPVAVTTYTMSICSSLMAEVRNGAVNLEMLLSDDTYFSVRTLTFPNDESVTISGTVDTSPTGDVSFVGIISGDVHLPSDVTGVGIYESVLYPNGGGSILEIGDGTLFTTSGNDVTVEIFTDTTFDPTVTFPFVEFRTVTDIGSLSGSDYTVTVHSVLDTVPEPMTICLLGLGGLLVRRRRGK